MINLFYLQNVLSSCGTCAVWVPCGHEIRLEARKQFLELLSLVSNPTAALVRLGLLPPLPPPVKEKPAKKTSGFTAPPPMMPPSIRGKAVAAAPEVHVAPKASEAVESLDSLLKKQASTEAAFKSTLDEQRAKQIEFERTRAEKLQQEQIARRRQWQQEDEARLEQIKRTLSSQQEQRLDEVCAHTNCRCDSPRACTYFMILLQTNNLLSFLQGVGSRTSAHLPSRPGSSHRSVGIASPKARSPKSSKTPIASPKARDVSPSSVKLSGSVASTKHFTYEEVLLKLESDDLHDMTREPAVPVIAPTTLPLMKFKDYESITEV